MGGPGRRPRRNQTAVVIGAPGSGSAVSKALAVHLLERIAGREIIVEWRSNSAHLHRPWRARNDLNVRPSDSFLMSVGVDRAAVAEHVIE